MFCGDVGAATHTVPRFLPYVLPCYLYIHSYVCVTSCYDQHDAFFLQMHMLMYTRVHGHLLKQSTHHKSFPCQLLKTKWALWFDLVYEEQIYNYLKEECGGGSKQGRRDRFLKREEWQAENYKEETSFHLECPDRIEGHKCVADVTFREGGKITRSRRNPGKEAIKWLEICFGCLLVAGLCPGTSIRRTQFKIVLVTKRTTMLISDHDLMVLNLTYVALQRPSFPQPNLTRQLLTAVVVR